MLQVKKVLRSETVRIPSTDHLRRMCHASKNIYNTALYITRQEFFDKKHIATSNYDLNHELKEDHNFKTLPSQTAQQSIGLVYRGWKSFFRSMKEYQNDPSKFTGRPMMPKYLKKSGEYIMLFSSQQCKIDRNGILKFPKKMNLEIKTRFDLSLDLREVRIIPRGVGYDIEIVYLKEFFALKRGTGIQRESWA